MPASSGDPVTAALRISLASSSKDGSLEKRLVASAKRVLLTRIEYEPTENYQSKVLQDLKSKYILLNPQSNGLSVHSSNKLGEASNGITAMKAEPETLPSPKVVLFDPEHIQLGWRGSYPVGAGMINMGNTCYMNSTLQALFHVPALVNWLLSDSNHLAKCEQANGAVQECTICAMAKTLKASHQKSGSVIKPLLIYHKLKMICKHMVHGQQEDAHEFMRYLIESMEKAYLSRVKPLKLDSSSKETTPFNQIFGGYIRTEVMCLQCRSVSTTFQHFQDLLLDIRRVSTLDEAMSAYFCRERLEGDDAYRCERCQRKVSATKKFSIERPPHVLCIQLKRFSVMGGKIAKHVPFRQRLDLSRYLCQRSVATYEPLQYKLVAMVTHMGPSPNCGHYTAVAETSGGQFYQFDDGMVRPIPLSVALNTNAYIIIYEMERNDLRSGSYSASYPSSSKNLSQKPATITSASLVNGSSSSDGTIHKKPSSIPVPQPSTPRPGGSVLGLPPIRERKEEFKKKHQQPGYNHSSSPSSVCSNVSHASSGQYEYQWVEKTHETIVREQKLEKMNGSAVSNGNHVDSVEPVLQNGLSGKENGWRDTYKHNGLNHEHDTPRNDSSGQTWNGNKEHWKTNGERERGTMWDGSRNSNNVNQLMKMSHRGYGNGTVTTWNGERSLVDREVEKDRRDERKRSYEDNYNEELDRGRVKKMRNKPLDQERPKSNPFQAYQNQKYNWNEHYYKNNHYYESNNYYNNKEHYRYQRGNKRYHPYPNFHKRKNNRFHNFGRDHWSKPKR